MNERKRAEEEELGGSEEEYRLEYELTDTVAYYDKEDHLRRSLTHQPNHAKAARKLFLLEKGSEVFL